MGIQPNKRWIKEWISEKQFLDLLHFCSGNVVWKEIETREDLREKIRPIKAAYDEAVRLAEQDIDEFIRRFDLARGDTTGDDGKRHPDDFQARIYDAVQKAELTMLVRPSTDFQEFDERPHIFRLIDGRGNPNFKTKASAEEVAKVAQALIDERGAKAYPMNTRLGYPTQLLKDVGEELSIHRRTVRRRLNQAEWHPPIACSVRVKR